MCPSWKSGRRGHFGKGSCNETHLFWNIIYDQRPLIQNGPSNGVFRHKKLVRSFIRYSSSEEIAKIRVPLLNYVYTYAGYDSARKHTKECVFPCNQKSHG